MNYSPAAQHGNNGYASMRDYPSVMNPLPDDTVVAMAYVPFQTDITTFDEVNALACGTLFPCLSKPFKGSGSR